MQNIHICFRGKYINVFFILLTIIITSSTWKLPIKHLCCTLCTFDVLATVKTISNDILENKKDELHWLCATFHYVYHQLFVCSIKPSYAYIEIDTLYNRGLRPQMFVFVYVSTKKIANVLHQSLFDVNQTIGKVINTQRIMIRLPL